MEIKLIIYLLIVGAYMYSFYKLFPLAGRKAWEGLVPFYNIYVWLKVAKRPWWYLILLIFPGVNVLMLMIMSANLATVYGKRSSKDLLLYSLLPFIFFPLLAMDSKTEYVGPIDRTKYKKTSMQEWRDAILFAIVAASLIRTYVMEAYTIPTASMEKSLLIGDFLFVSKAAYGPKIPQTPLSFPFAHHSLPFTNNSVKSYLEWMDLPYFRLPGLGKVERNDVVVFNYPEGDTVCVEVQSNKSFNQMRREYQLVFGDVEGESYLWNGIPQNKRGTNAIDYLAQMLYSMGLDGKTVAKVVNEGFDRTVRPIDKRENYIKRCVAIPGDTLRVENGVLYVNGETAYIPPEFQWNYVVINNDPLRRKRLKEEFGISLSDIQQRQDTVGYVIPLTLESYKKLSKWKPIDDISPMLNRPGTVDVFSRIFPNVTGSPWTEDFFGPIIIPKKGETVELTLANLPIYRRLITIYEGHALSIDNDQIVIDGQNADSYTFEMDYYWMMGDNRHNSADSRFWGFVPEDHIVGKASFIWLSLDQELGWFSGKIRWDRFFNTIE